MSMLKKTERLIDEINKLHLAFSKDYFETGKIRKVTSKTYSCIFKRMEH